MSWVLDVNRYYSECPLCPSGEWDGVYYHEGLAHKIVLRLSFSHTCVDGSGYDEIGEFEILGRYIPWSKECVFSQRYLNGETVWYSGVFDGETIEGKWYYPEAEIGEFRLWPFHATTQPAPSRTGRSDPHLQPDSDTTGQISPRPYSRQARRARLLTWVLGNEAQADRLIAYERRCAPEANEADCIERAVEHLLHDNTTI
jgi:hypothetical protein